MKEVSISEKVHRLIPSRFPPVSLFDWAESAKELEEIAELEGLTNDRLLCEYGHLNLISKEDWISGPGSTPLMAAFTHPGFSRFTDGTYGVYYAALQLDTALTETKFHRELFLKASHEAPMHIQMREYIAHVTKKLIDISDKKYKKFLDPDIDLYTHSQRFARKIRAQNIFGLHYPRVRHRVGKCVAIFRPPALTIPIQGCHLDYIWDGNAIIDVRLSTTF